jgi:hypothetical protein
MHSRIVKLIPHLLPLIAAALPLRGSTRGDHDQFAGKSSHRLGSRHERRNQSQLFKGIALTSPITQPGSPGATVTSQPWRWQHHGVETRAQRDSCSGSLAADAHAVFIDLTGVSRRQTRRRSLLPRSAGPRCRNAARSRFGYAGDEDEVVAAIAKFILAHSSSRRGLRARWLGGLRLVGCAPSAATLRLPF